MFARLTASLRRPETALFLMTLGAYAYFYQAGGWNQNSRFDLTRSIVERGRIDIDPYHANTGDKAKRGAHHYCDKAPGVSFLAVPAYAVVHAVAAPPPGVRPSPGYLAAASWISTIFAIGVPSAIAVVMLSLLLGRLGLSPAARVGVAAAYGLASLAFPYATLLYGHQLVAALSTIAFAIFVKARKEEARPIPLAIAGFALATAVAVEYPAALIAMVLGIYALVYVRPLHRIVWIFAGAAIPAVALAVYHAAAFGGPLVLPYEFSTQKHRHLGFFMGLGAPNPTALLHILITPYRGIFLSMPWLVYVFPGAWYLVRRARAGAEVIVCGAIVLLFVWLNASLVDWEGGWAMGARYLVPALPFLAILAAGMLLPHARRWVTLLARAGFGVTATIAFVLMLAGTSVKPEVPVWIRDPYGAYLLPAFRRGDLAISTQSIDMAGAPKNGRRYASHLGIALGMRGKGSLLPLTFWLAGCGAWLAFSLRRGVDCTPCASRTDSSPP